MRASQQGALTFSLGEMALWAELVAGGLSLNPCCTVQWLGGLQQIA